jgi:Putative Ig domain/Secretion system C-terminal sorting domain
MKKSLLFAIISFILIISSAKVMAASATLTGLAVSATALSPTFASGTTNYAMSVNGSTVSTTVTPIASGGSTIKVNGTTVASGYASGAIALNAGINTITVTVTKAGFTTGTYTITITRESISYTGSPFIYYTGLPIATLTSTEVGDTPTSYSGALPAGLLLNIATGDITGTPTAPTAASNYTITATYTGGLTATTTINITVLASAISYTGSPFTYAAGTPITTLIATETGGNPTSYSGALPTGLLLNIATGDITGTPTAPSAATNYTITANYSTGPSATTVINIKVLAPTISYAGSPLTYYSGSPIATLTSTEINGNPTSYSTSPALPAGLALNAATGDITGTPAATSAATPYTITATYAGGVTATATINIQVLAPTISYTGSPFTYTTGTAITSLTPTVAGIPTGYSISPALSAGLLFSTTTGIISGTPTATATVTTYTITATYAGGITATAAVIITVNPPVPVITYTPSINVYTTGTGITSLTPVITGGAVVSYSINTALPTGLLFDTVTGIISGTPTAISPITTYTVTATNAGGTGSTTVKITVNPPAPVISYTPSANNYVLANAIPALTPANTGGAVTSYSISTALPLGLTFSTTTGVISGTPLLVSATTTYTITATSAGGAGSTTVTLKVDALPPAIVYTPSTNIYMVGGAITTLSPTITVGTPSSYSISIPLPVGLLFNTVTGVISGTPAAVSLATTYTITASNAGGSGSTTVKISCVNPPVPVISYTPSTNVYTTGAAITSLTPNNTGGPIAGYSISTALPAGLAFNTTTGVISGTPTAVSLLTNYTITATNAGGSGSTTVTLTVNPPPPVISYSPSTNIYVVGTAIASLTPTNTGGAAASYSISTALPAGLLFNTTTGIISGTPAVASLITTYTITATNAGGSGSTTVTLTVNPLPPVISYTPSINFYTVSTAIAPLTPTNTGGAAASYSISAPLSAGLLFNTTTGVISGTPTVDITATTYTITATNAGGNGSTSVTITVYPLPPAITYTPSTNIYIVGAAITPLAPANTGGVATSFIIGPSLPPGLAFNTTTGVISGTPIPVSPVTTYTISAENAGGLGTTSITLSCINPMPPIISYTPSTNVYTVGAAITSLTPANTGGAAASYSISTALPAGLLFNTTTGIISGTPTAVSAATVYTITATNAAGNGSTTVTLTVNPQAPVIIYTPSTNIYTVGTAITSLTPANTGGAPTSYSINTALPAGLAFSTTTGVISGTPTAISAVTTYTITASNATSSGNTTVTLSINNTAPAIAYSPSTVSYSVGTTITPAVPVNTGGAPSGYTITGGTLPAGLSFNTSTGVISGTPTVVFATTTFTIKATNGGGNSSNFLIITVSPQAPIISYTPSTNAYPINAPIATLSPTNTGGPVTGYSYAATGTPLTGATQSGPSLMTIDASGNIYEANYNNGTISRWNSSHTYLGTYTTGKTMSNPEGIVFDSAGNSYVEDTGAGAIYKFNGAGVYQSTIISGLSHPLGISIDPSDNLYIATYNFSSPFTSSVTKYNTSGTLLLTLPNAQMNESDGVTVDGSGTIYVLNRGNNLTGTNMGNVTVYNSSGAYVGVFSSGYNDPLAISTDPSGNVFVADSHNNDVKIYSSNGVLLNTITGFNDVEGFVADGSGNLYVSDFTNNTVKEFAALGGYHISAPLPPGLSFNTANGQITGTSTSVFPVTTYTVTAYNITGSGTTTVTLSCYQSDDWTGITSTNWNTAANWLSGVVPTSTDQAIIGVNRAFTNFPNVLAAAGTINVGSIAFGNKGGQAAGVIVNTGSTLNVLGAITYQSDASSGLGYTCTLSGAGTLNANSISVIANTSLAGSYTEILASSVNNLNVATNIALTSSNTGAALFNSTFNLTGGTALLSGILQTANTTASSSSFLIVPATTATLQLANAAALSGLSATGTNVVTFNNPGATVQYAGVVQTVYTSASINGLPSGVNYQNISFSGTGLKTASSGNLNIGGDFTNALLGNFLNLSSPTVNFNGTTQNLAGGTVSGTTFYNVTFSGAGTKTMSSGQFYVASPGVLTMLGNNPATVLAAGGLLTLNSDATGSASVAAIPAGPGITGNVNVQRYITGGTGYRGYRLLSSPVYGASIGLNNDYSINYIKNSSFITGTTGSPGGFDKIGNPTLYLYRENLAPSNTTFTSGNFRGINTIGTAPNFNYLIDGDGVTPFNIPVGNGVLFFFRGDKTTVNPYTTTTIPIASTFTTSGTLNQGQIIVKDWYTPGSLYLGWTNATANAVVRGFNLVGNPYASSIDWEQFNTTTTTSGIYGNNVRPTIYELNPATNNYDTYQKGGAYTNHGRRTVVSGQGFFILAANSTNPQLIFNESAKSTIQNTGLDLFMATKGDIRSLNNAVIDQHLRLQIAMDSINTDDIYIGFNAAATTKFLDDEDAPYKPGTGKVSLASFSSDNVSLAINKMPLPGAVQSIIPLNITASAYGTYKLNMTELEAIPQIYEVWLMDAYKKDSLDMRHNTTYAFDITNDTNSYGSKRFKLVIRQNKALGLHLLNFTAAKATEGSQIKWVTENEQNYTNFTVERSTDEGATFNVLGGFASSALGTYSFSDKAPPVAVDMYRLKLEDLNGAISYSNIVTLMYANINSLPKSSISLYPNPTSGPINLTITPAFNLNAVMSQNNGPGVNPAAVYSIKIVNASGSIVKTATTTQKEWETNVSNLLPGTYIMQVVNNNDNSLIGKGTFIKL